MLTEGFGLFDPVRHVPSDGVDGPLLGNRLRTPFEPEVMTAGVSVAVQELDDRFAGVSRFVGDGIGT